MHVESSHSKMSNVNTMSLEDKNPVLDDEAGHRRRRYAPRRHEHASRERHARWHSAHRGGRGGGGRDIKRASWRQRRDADELDEDIDGS